LFFILKKTKGSEALELHFPLNTTDRQMQAGLRPGCPSGLLGAWLPDALGPWAYGADSASCSSRIFRKAALARPMCSSDLGPHRALGAPLAL
jgi:hypothetical protein